MVSNRRLARSIAVMLVPFVASCGASVPLIEHRAAIDSQRAEYEARLKRAEEARRGEADACTRASDDGLVDKGELEARIARLEIALADKERLLRRPQEVAAKGPWRDRAKAALEGALKEIPEADRSIESADGALVLVVALDAFLPPGATRLSAEGERRAKNLAEALAKEGEIHVRIAVHSDAVQVSAGGAVADTWELTQRQGWALLSAMLAAGFDPSRAALVAHGHFAPRASNDTELGRRQNRRLELSVKPRR
jgi:chemotaxis protein MotB